MLFPYWNTDDVWVYKTSIAFGYVLYSRGKDLTQNQCSVTGQSDYCQGKRLGNSVGITSKCHLVKLGC